MAVERLADEDPLGLRQRNVEEFHRIAFAAAEPKIGRPDPRAARHHHRTLHRVLQLADVARPGVRRERSLGARRKAGHGSSVAGCLPPQKVPGQQGDVFAAVSKRRELQLDGVQPVEQVFAEVTSGHRLAEVGVGGGDDAHIHVPHLRGADPLNLPALEHAQEPGLLSQRNVGDLIEKQGAPVGEFETPDPFGPGVGEGTLDVPEDLALEDPFAKPSRVHGDEVVVGSIRHGMQPPGDHLLTRPVFPGDQHVRVRGTDAFDDLQHRSHRLGFGDELRRALPSEADVLGLEPLGTPQGPRQVDLRPDRGQQPLVVPRLLDVVARSPAHRLHSSVHTCPRGHGDHRQRFVQLAQGPEQVQSLPSGRGVAGIVQIEQHEIEISLLDGALDRVRGRDSRGLVALALQQEEQSLQDVGLVVRDQDACRHRLPTLPENRPFRARAAARRPHSRSARQRGGWSCRQCAHTVDHASPCRSWRHRRATP